MLAQGGEIADKCFSVIACDKRDAFAQGSDAAMTVARVGLTTPAHKECLERRGRLGHQHGKSTVNAPDPAVMMMQGISGLFCAVSMASLIARYMSWVIAFFSGRRAR